MSDDRTTAALEEANALHRQRSAWDSLWQELADVVHPRRGLVTGRPAPDTSPDRQRLAEAFDGTAMRSCRTLANGQFARITPMGARWYALRAPEEVARYPAAQRWYQECSEILARKLADSNFYNRGHEHYLDRGAFGTAATEITAGPQNRGLHFRSYQVGTYSIAHNSQDEVDTLARVARMTPRQIVDTWPDSTPESVCKLDADANKRNVPLDVTHFIRPRRDRDPFKTDQANKPWESLHILTSENATLSAGGFDEFPVAVSRWELWGDSPYGWPPSLLALPEATQANFMEQLLDTLAETSAFPRVLYPSNLKGDVDFRALGLTCYDPANGGKPEEWLTGGRYDIGKDRSADKRRAIEEAFFVPLFNAISTLDRDATATEVRAIVSESRELFHPIFANLVREFLRPVLLRSFSLLLRQGELPPPPAAVIQRTELGAFITEPAVEFTSAMALALEQSQLANFADVVAVLSPLAATDPGVFDFFDPDAIGPMFARYKGLPAETIRSPEAIAAVRSARAQAAQAAAMKDLAQGVGALGGIPAIRDVAGAIDL